MTLLFYSTFFSKKRIFYDYFRYPHRFKIINYTKKGLGIFTTLIFYAISLNYFFSKKIPSEVA